MAKKKKKKSFKMKSDWDVNKESALATFKVIPGLPSFEIALNGIVRSVNDGTYIIAYNSTDGWLNRLVDVKGHKGSYTRQQLLRHTYG